MSKDMKKIMEAYRKGILLNEKRYSIGDIRYRKDKKPSADVKGSDFDKDGVENQFDDVPFDANFHDIDGVDQEKFADAVGVDPNVIGRGITDTLSDKFKDYYKSQGVENPRDITEPIPAGPDPDQEKSADGDQEPSTDLDQEEVAAALTTLDPSNFGKGAKAVYNDGEVTVFEFMEWMSGRELLKSNFERFKENLQTFAQNFAEKNPKIVKMLPGDATLRGLIGQTITFFEEQGYALLKGGAKGGLLDVIAGILDQAGVPNTLGFRRMLARVISAAIIQTATDKAEDIVDGVIKKLTDSSNSLKRKSMKIMTVGDDGKPVLKYNQDIQEMFDVPEEIVKMFQGKLQDNGQRLISKFFNEYRTNLVKIFEMAKEATSDPKKYQNIINQDLTEFLKDQDTSTNAAKDALEYIRNAYNLKGIKVTTKANDEKGTSSRTVTAGTVNESKRRRIVYRGKK